MDTRSRAALADAQRICLLAAGAVAVGVHAGLAPEHLSEWPPLGAAFVAAAAAALAATATFAVQPTEPWPARVLAGLLGSFVAAYALTRLFALPPLDPEREPLDPIGLATTAIEAAGVIVALRLGRQALPRRHAVTLSRGGTP